MSATQRAKTMSKLSSRRRFFGQAGLATAGVLGAASLPFKVSAQATDFDILNFALNLEYLEAEYYLRAVFGTGLSDADISGTGALGPVIVKEGSTIVPWENDNVRQYAVEIANDELAHVRFIRAALAQFGQTPVARPTIDLRDSFTAAATAAGLISAGGGGAAACPPGQPPFPSPGPSFVPTADCQGYVPIGHPLDPMRGGGGGGSTFDPFGSELAFLLGAFIFEDVGVTAYKGAAPLLSNKAVLEAAAGLLGTESYHAGTIRTVLFARGAIDAAQRISDLRDAADGPGDKDQGLVLDGNANIVPTDANGLVFSRTVQEVLNIVYLGSPGGGGFFPNRLNGPLA